MRASYYRARGHFKRVPRPCQRLPPECRSFVCDASASAVPTCTSIKVTSMIGTSRRDHWTRGLCRVVSSPRESGFVQGDRVTVIPILSCETCYACRMGASYLCHHLKVLGVDAPGGMQDYWAVPSDRLLKVPDSISEDDVPLIEPLAVAAHDVGRAEIKQNDTVVVFGGGPIGCYRPGEYSPRRSGESRGDQPASGRDARAVWPRHDWA